MEQNIENDFFMEEEEFLQMHKKSEKQEKELQGKESQQQQRFFHITQIQRQNLSKYLDEESWFTQKNIEFLKRERILQNQIMTTQSKLILELLYLQTYNENEEIDEDQLKEILEFDSQSKGNKRVDKKGNLLISYLDQENKLNFIYPEKKNQYENDLLIKKINVNQIHNQTNKFEFSQKIPFQPQSQEINSLDIKMTQGGLGDAFLGIRTTFNIFVLNLCEQKEDEAKIIKEYNFKSELLDMKFNQKFNDSLLVLSKQNELFELIQEDGRQGQIVFLNKQDEVKELKVQDILYNVDEFYSPNLYILHSNRQIFQLDKREGKSQVIYSLGQKNLARERILGIKSFYKEKQYFETVDNFNYCIFDIRNPAKSVLEINHFQDFSVPYVMENIYSGKNSFLDNIIEIEDELVYSFSPEKGGTAQFQKINNLEQIDKNLKSMGRLSSQGRFQHTQNIYCDYAPKGLFSTNLANDQFDIKGIQMVPVSKNQIYFFQLDSGNGISVQELKFINQKHKNKNLFFNVGQNQQGEEDENFSEDLGNLIENEKNEGNYQIQNNLEGYQEQFCLQKLLFQEVFYKGLFKENENCQTDQISEESENEKNYNNLNEQQNNQNLENLENQEQIQSQENLFDEENLNKIQNLKEININQENEKNQTIEKTEKNRIQELNENFQENIIKKQINNLEQKSNEQNENKEQNNNQEQENQENKNNKQENQYQFQQIENEFLYRVPEIINEFDDNDLECVEYDYQDDLIEKVDFSTFLRNLIKQSETLKKDFKQLQKQKKDIETERRKDIDLDDLILTQDMSQILKNQDIKNFANPRKQIKKELIEYLSEQWDQ